MICIFCDSEKANWTCENCNNTICKKHLSKLNPEDYSIKSLNPPKVFSQTTFCIDCFESIVQPEIEIFNEQLEKAKNVGIWTENYRGKLPITKKALKPIQFKDFTDKKDLILALAFRAIEMGFNGVIELKWKSSKVRKNEYQKMIWEGQGLPVELPEEWLEKSDNNFFN